MELIARKLQESDWETLKSWWSNWSEWKTSAPKQDALPDNGTGGIIIEKDGIPIVAGFIYLSNSKTAFFDWVISNPDYRQSDRTEAIKLLITSIEYVIKNAGFKYIFTITRNKSLLKIHGDLGYTIDPTKSHELIKIL